MLEKLRQHDPDLAELPSGDGSVLVSPSLQGRIFCELGGELVHRLDVERLESPVPNEFNNLGGNSLWPAPEGGAFAFNYAPGSDAWLVQEGIAGRAAELASCSVEQAVLRKRIELVNRKGVAVLLDYGRRIAALAAGELPKLPGVKCTGYDAVDTLVPAGVHSADDVLLAPWSLEQFPGGTGVTAFCRVDSPETAVNFDFYGMPETNPTYGDGMIALALGGVSKFQIGIKVANSPLLLGALDTRRELLFLRFTPRQKGRYFNIADNDQPAGPWSAADMYSVFSGGDLDFFELETIGAMQTENGQVAGGSLSSRTTIMSGPVAALREWLRRKHGVSLAGA